MGDNVAMSLVAMAPADLSIATPDGVLVADLVVPPMPHGVVVFAHGSGSLRRSARNHFVANMLVARGLSTVLVDLLTPEEIVRDEATYELRFDIALLADRVVAVVDALARDERTSALELGLFGASTGASATLVAAARRPRRIRAVVSRSGRPDLVRDALPDVQAPTLFIVETRDPDVLALDRDALERLGTYDRELVVIQGASHPFEEPAALDRIADVAGAWFDRYLRSPQREWPL